MNELPYEDDRCFYCEGDPRFEDRYCKGKMILTSEGIKFEGEENSIFWPRSAIRSVKITSAYRVDLSCFGPEAAGDIELGLIENRAPEPALTLVIDDREGVAPRGFHVEVVFRNEYYARVFGKRTAEAFGVPFLDHQA